MPRILDGGPNPIFRNPAMFLFVFFIKNIKFIILFYVHYLYLIPYFFNTKKYYLYILYTSLLFLIVAAIPFFSEMIFHPHLPEMIRPDMHELHERHEENHRFHRRGNFDNGMHFFMTIIVTLFPFLINAYKNWIVAQKENLVMELALLKSQINHHFLFNSLNNIYSLSVQQNEKAPAAIHSLSFIMRYILDETNKETTSLEKELEYINHYISLQRLRINEKIKLMYSVDGEIDSQQISPMILIPFIENCFKHGLSAIKPGEIEIKIHIEGNSIKLYTRNNKYPMNILSNVESGIGIKNVLKRLEYDYEGKYTLEINESEEKYIVNLKIELS
jgi:two-component sensor histidine kinase